MQPLRVFFRRLSRVDGALLLIGDSVMQQFYSAIACELEREGVWKYPSRFTNTDEVQYVRVVDDSSHAGYNNKDNNSLGGGSDRSSGRGRSSSTAVISSTDTNHNVLIKFLPIYHFVDGR